MVTFSYESTLLNTLCDPEKLLSKKTQKNQDFELISPMLNHTTTLIHQADNRNLGVFN